MYTFLYTACIILNITKGEIMEQKIPYHLFKEYIEHTRNHPTTTEETTKHYKDMEKHANSMREVLWEDITKLTKEDLERIPIAWLYDWAHITANYEYQEKITELYDNYEIPKLSNSAFYKKYYKNNKQ